MLIITINIFQMATATIETSGIDREIEWYGVTKQLLSFPCKGGYGHFTKQK